MLALHADGSVMFFTRPPQVEVPLADAVARVRRALGYGVATAGELVKRSGLTWKDTDAALLALRGELCVSHGDRDRYERFGLVKRWKCTPDGIERLS